jgi:hypothetical protein
MSVFRWLVTLGCLCLLAIPALADSTVQDFSNPGVKGTNYAEYGTGTGAVMTGGPAGAANYYRFTQSGVGNTNNIIAFDLTAPGPTAHVVGSFDFRIGGTASPTSHADGLGLCFISTANFGTTGNGPTINEEGGTTLSSGLGIGLDTYNNADPFDVGNPDLPNGSDADHVSVHYRGLFGPGREAFVYAVDMFALTNKAYNLHQDFIDDGATPFDHCDFTVDIDPNGGGTVSVFITSKQADATNGQRFKVLTAVCPDMRPYEMRVGFGGRTGGADDGHDLANVNISFSP